MDPAQGKSLKGVLVQEAGVKFREKADKDFHTHYDPLVFIYTHAHKDDAYG